MLPGVWRWEWALWCLGMGGGAGQRQVGSARIPECAQAVIALDAGQRIVFHNHHPLPEEEKKGTTTKTTTKFFFFFLICC